jgi:hypothetical protein
LIPRLEPASKISNLVTVQESVFADPAGAGVPTFVQGFVHRSFEIIGAGLTVVCLRTGLGYANSP